MQSKPAKPAQLIVAMPSIPTTHVSKRAPMATGGILEKTVKNALKDTTLTSPTTVVWKHVQQAKRPLMATV